MVGLVQSGSDWTPNWTNPGLLQIRFQCIWRGAPNALKSDLKKPRICPIWANLAHFGAKPTIPGLSFLYLPYRVRFGPK